MSTSARSFRMFQILYRIPRMQRHVVAFYRYSTPQKLKNLLLVEWERTRQRTILKSLPYMATVDLGNVCNYQCALCPTGQGTQGRPRGLMTLEGFRRMINDLIPYLYKIAFYNWGEPLLNPQLCSIISFTHTNRIGTAVSTNLSRLPKEGAEGLVGSGLDDLIVSLNGLSQETYQIYHRGGNFDRVVDHIKAVVEEKRHKGARNPHIEVQLIAMRHNEKEIPLLKEFCTRIGADSYRVVPMLFNDIVPRSEDATLQELCTEWLPRNPRYVHPYYRPFLKGRTGTRAIGSRLPQGSGSCFWLWRSVVINWDGGVAPCCILFDQSDDFGNLQTEPFAAIWNNPYFVASRRHVGRKRRGGLEPRTFCIRHCTGWPY